MIQGLVLDGGRLRAVDEICCWIAAFVGRFTPQNRNFFYIYLGFAGRDILRFMNCSAILMFLFKYPDDNYNSLSPEHHPFEGLARGGLLRLRATFATEASVLEERFYRQVFRELEQSQSELVSNPFEAKPLAGLCTADGLNVK